MYPLWSLQLPHSFAHFDLEDQNKRLKLFSGEGGGQKQGEWGWSDLKGADVMWSLSMRKSKESYGLVKGRERDVKLRGDRDTESKMKRKRGIARLCAVLWQCVGSICLRQSASVWWEASPQRPLACVLTLLQGDWHALLTSASARASFSQMKIKSVFNHWNIIIHSFFLNEQHLLWP